MKILKLYKKRKEKISKHQEKLLKDYEEGKILQIDKNIDNKEYLKSKEKV